VCGAIPLPTLKQQPKNSPNQKSKEIQSPQCCVQFYSQHTHTKNKKQTTHGWIKKTLGKGKTSRTKGNSKFAVHLRRLPPTLAKKENKINSCGETI
jgi:hypothetical protein